jgi:tRNA threonylcarbamoyl adenosine modification protein YjeE
MTHSLLHAESLADFRRIAREFARTLRPGDVVALHGDLGAGKTTFVSFIREEIHGNTNVSSPTFIFRQRYEGTPPIEHLDLYRLESAEELTELGLEDAFSTTTIALVEWAERVPELLPAHAAHVTITGAGSEPRRIRFLRRH